MGGRRGGVGGHGGSCCRSGGQTECRNNRLTSQSLLRQKGFR
ncbi:hypothetical protein C7S17_4379 [Burkholderia thailandensis]|nr:hypothetical protein [Burkholderia thailandensis]